MKIECPNCGHEIEQKPCEKCGWPYTFKGKYGSGGSKPKNESESD